MIRFEGVSKVYDSPYCEAIMDFHEHIRPGEFAVLAGRSGSGKSTILSMILKEIEPTSGRIYVDRQDLSNIGPGKVPMYRTSIGMIFQDFRLVEDMDAYENVKLAYMLSGARMKDAPRKIAAVFKMLGIETLHKRLPKEMSGGQQQKVCLARALINTPRILLADEPTANLDYESSKEIYSLFKLINSQNITILMATHDIEGVKDCNCRIINLDKEEKND